MPRFNGMGPCGMGSKTGKGMGPCGRSNYGRGRGYGRGFYPISVEEERNFLEEEKAYLETRIKELGQILDEVGE